jgi:two-component system OmpR family response regulator
MIRPQGRWQTALTGTLEHVGLSSLLVLLEMERRTGILELRQGGRAGVLALRDGCVVSANVGGQPLPHAEAICELIRWTTGRFAFRIGEVERPDEAPSPSTTALLLEVARRNDELLS